MLEDERVYWLLLETTVPDWPQLAVLFRASAETLALTGESGQTGSEPQ